MNQDTFDRGLKIRREVLGEDYVNDALTAATSFTWPIQELVTCYAWGEVWARPGLDRRTRSIINLALMTALNRPDELRLHIVGALNNGLSPEDIREVFLQTAIYCGVPAAIDSFRIASQVFDQANIRTRNRQDSPA